MIRKKAIITTVIATVLFVLAYSTIELGWLTLDDVSFLRLPSQGG
jgi:predicted secreted protein